MGPREFVGPAIGLHRLAFNTPSAIGPPISGVVIATLGAAPCMAANAVLTLATVAALIFMKPVAPSSTQRESVLQSILDGIRFLYEHPVLRWVVLLLVLTSLAVRSYGFLLPAYAAHVIHTDARGLGWLMAASGLGAIGGALATAAIPGSGGSARWRAAPAVSWKGTGSIRRDSR